MLLFLSSILFIIGIVHSDDPNCPSGSDYIAQLDICLAVVKNGARFGFYQADVECTARGGQLTSIHNAFENTLIYGVASYKENIQTGAYLGALRSSGLWTWMDGTNVSYSNWAAGQPTERDDCAILSMSDSKWYSESCGQQNATYFCTLPSQGSATTTTTPSPASCSTGWTHYNGNCYLFYNTYPTRHNWTTSRSMCQTMGGDLASIHSKEENEFLTNSANPQPCAFIWIGLQWNGNYSWSDGSTVDFFNATEHEQQALVHYALYPSCVGRAAGWWGVYGITDGFYTFICKKPATSSFRALTNKTNNNEKFPRITGGMKVEGGEKRVRREEKSKL